MPVSCFALSATFYSRRLLDLTSGEAADLAEGPLVNEVRQLEAELEAGRECSHEKQF